MPPNPEFMKEAVEEACRGVHLDDGGPFGAVVVKEGKVIAQGHNMVLVQNDPTAHAEVTAIRNACKALKTFDLSGCTLYTSCYPCPMCMGACLWAKLDATYYAASSLDGPQSEEVPNPYIIKAASVGFDDQNFYDFVKDPHSDEKRVLEKLQVEDYMRPFSEWTAHPNKKLY